MEHIPDTTTIQIMKKQRKFNKKKFLLFIFFTFDKIESSFLSFSLHNKEPAARTYGDNAVPLFLYRKHLFIKRPTSNENPFLDYMGEGGGGS